MVNGRAQDAHRFFTDALRADPHNAKAHFRLGEIALLRRDFGPAGDQFTRALASSENLDERERALCDLGLAIARDDRHEANRLARDFRAGHPQDPDLQAIHRQFGAFFGKIDEEQQPRRFPRRRRLP